MLRSVMDLLNGWGTLLGRGHVTRRWKQVHLCVMWGLWRERNARLFEDVELPVVDLCRNVLNICNMFGSRRIARIVLCSLSFYIHVLLFSLIRDTFVYFMCTKVVPFCAFY
jgi:hypothetical protein